MRRQHRDRGRDRLQIHREQVINVTGDVLHKVIDAIYRSAEDGRDVEL